MLDFARGKLRSPQVIIRVCSKNERSVSIESPLRFCICLCVSMLRECGELHDDVAWGLDVRDSPLRWNSLARDRPNKKKKNDEEPVYEGQCCAPSEHTSIILQHVALLFRRNRRTFLLQRDSFDFSI